MSQANTSRCATMSLIAITIQGIGNIYIYKGDKPGCVCRYAMHCTLCMSYNSPLSILGYLS